MRMVKSLSGEGFGKVSTNVWGEVGAAVMRDPIKRVVFDGGVLYTRRLSGTTHGQGILGLWALSAAPHHLRVF